MRCVIKPIRINKIRDDDTSKPGLCPSEISFIRLLDKITSGATIQINETGTTLTYRPGSLVGGDRISHDCHTSRAIGYYLEPLLMLAPFCKYALNVTLRGSTHTESDICADTISAISVPLVRRLTSGKTLSPNVEVKRRATNGNGGIVMFRCDVISGKLAAVDLLNNGVVKRVRGIAFGNRCSPGHITRIIDSCRGVLNRFSPDVYIHSDHGNEKNCGNGFALHLVAETTQGCLLGADWTCANPTVTPEQTAKLATGLLLEEIEGGGCIDSNHVPLALFYAAVSDSDMSRVRVGRLTETSISFLRDLDSFLGVRFNLRVLGGAVKQTLDEEEEESDSSDEEDVAEQDRQNYGIIMSCIGAGVSNIARQRF